MSYTDGKVLLHTPPRNGVLSIGFEGMSNREDVELFKEAIDHHLHPKTKVKKAIFDLSGIDPVINAAGRILDLACDYRAICKIPVEVRMPVDIYADLQELTPEEMPLEPPIDKPVKVRGVTVVVTKASDLPEPWLESAPSYFPAEPATEEAAEKRSVILTCVGVVNHVDESSVSVTLYTDEGEVIGEFDRSQFSRKEIEPGLVFDYEAAITKPGITEISIDFLTEQNATDEEMVDAAEEDPLPLDKLYHPKQKARP